MARVALFLAVLLAFTASNAFLIQSKQAINWPFNVCGQGPWKMTSLTLSAQPTRNINDDIVATGTVTGYVEFDHVDVDVKLNGLFLHSETAAYNQSFDSGDILVFKYTNFIVSFAPAGTYLLTFNFKDKSGAAQGCFSFSFKL